MNLVVGRRSRHFDALNQFAGAAGRRPDFVVDAYCKVRCIKNGEISNVPGKLDVGALWGVDGESPNRRTNLQRSAYISPRKADLLLMRPFSVLLCHDSPMDAKRNGYGSQIISDLIHLSKPHFVFFGHYRGEGQRIERDYGTTEVYHLLGMEFSGKSGSAELGSVGALSWDGEKGRFEYLEKDWLKTFTRHNWRYR